LALENAVEFYVKVFDHFAELICGLVDFLLFLFQLRL
jgi:hypothetical protein